MLHSHFGKRVRSAAQTSASSSTNISSNSTSDQATTSSSATTYTSYETMAGAESLATPASPQKRKKEPYGDRFIPDRSNQDLAATNFSLMGDAPSTPSRPKRKISSTETDAQRDEANKTYNAVLRSELFGSNEEDTLRNMNNASPQTPSRNIFTFKTPRKKTQAGASQYESPTQDTYSISPVTFESQKLLLSPRKTPRHVSKIPFKVLDAPELQDDFYLNLVDWSSANILGVGLATCVYLWNACSSKVTKLCDLGPYDTVTSVSWMQRGTHIAVGTNRGYVQIWDAQRCKKVRTMTGHTARVGTLAWNDHILTSGSRDRLIYHRDVRSPDPHFRKLNVHKQEVCGLKWNPEENQLASGGNDNKLLVWDRYSEAPLYRFTDHTAAVKAIAWSPHQHGLLASGGGTADKKIRFWNSLTGNALNCIDTGSQVCNLSWSKTANELVSTHGYSQNSVNVSNQVIVWKYPTMQQVATLTGHTFRVLYLAMSPDGQTIVTGAGDETLRFWNVFNKGRVEKRSESVLNTFSHIR